MTKYETLKADIEQLAQGTTDTEALKKLGSINAQIDQMEKDENDLIDKHRKVVEDYRESIIHATLKPMNTPEETGKSVGEPKSLESIIDGIVNKKGN